MADITKRKVSFPFTQFGAERPLDPLKKSTQKNWCLIASLITVQSADIRENIYLPNKEHEESGPYNFKMIHLCSSA